MKWEDNHCPVCKHLLDAVTCTNGPESTKPYPGNPSICMYCGEITVFADDLSMRKPTGAEMVEFMTDPNWEILRAALRFIAQRIAKGKSVN
jgi:hypothetical protein